MKPAQAIAILCGICLWTGCADDHGTASTEVENEIQAARLSAVAEGPSAFVSSSWTLVDADGDTLASGSTDSAGAIAATLGLRDTNSSMLLRVAGRSDTLRAILFALPGFAEGDTLRASANILTESVVRVAGDRRLRALDRAGLARLGDSVLRSMGGVDLAYARIASHPGDRDLPSDVLLEIVSLQATRSGASTSLFIEGLRTDPRRSILRDSLVARDLSDGMRRLALPPDSQAIVAFELDSLGGRAGELYRGWEVDRFREDSTLFAALLPWVADEAAESLRRGLLLRADRLGTEAYRSVGELGSPILPEPYMRTVRRASIRLWVHLLDDLPAPPADTLGNAALDHLFRPAESTLREAWRRLRPEVWNGQDSVAADFLRAVLDTRRDETWSTTTLVASPDPLAYALARWPMPTGMDLDGLLDSLAISGRWGKPSDILGPLLRAAPAP